MAVLQNTHPKHSVRGEVTGARWCCFKVRLRKHSVLFITGHIINVRESRSGSVLFCLILLCISEILFPFWWLKKWTGSCSLSCSLKWGYIENRELESIITCGTQKQSSFSRSWYAATLWSMRQLKSINVKVRRAAFSELGTLIVDFLCSQSVVRLLPYRDTTQRKVCGQREEKRRSDDTRFSSLSLSTAESVQRSSVQFSWELSS